MRGVKEIGTQILKGGASTGQRPSLADTGAGAVNMTVNQRKAMQRGEAAYKELCFSCHGADGKGAPMQGRRPARCSLRRWPRRRGSLAHRDYVIKVLLHGLTGEIDGKTFGTGVMVPMGTNTDEWIADVASYVRNAFGNAAPLRDAGAGRRGAEEREAAAAVDACRAARRPCRRALTQQPRSGS